MGLLLVPLTITYVNPLQYGIWLTITSIVGWMNTFDVGLSHGLRNKVATSLALQQTDAISKYVSSTYAMLSFISVVIFSFMLIIGSRVDWNRTLNIDQIVTFNIWPVLVITLGAFCIQFILQPINSILTATHQPFKASLLTFYGQAISLLFIYIASISLEPNLLLLVVIMSGCPIIILGAANLYYFLNSLKAYAPKFSSIDIKIAKKCLRLGGTFFVLQMGALILYQTNSIIITKTLGPEYVTTFNVAHRLFSVPTAAFMIFMTPYWSAFTDAYAKNELRWIHQSIRQLKKVWLLFSFIAIILYLASQIIYKFWVGDSISVPDSLSLAMAFYVMAISYQAIYAYTLNGIGKLKVQLIVIVGCAIINVPMSILLIMKLGLYGIVIGNIVVFLLMNVIFTHQINLILKNKAKGVWNK